MFEISICVLLVVLMAFAYDAFYTIPKRRLDAEERRRRLAMDIGRLERELFPEWHRVVTERDREVAHAVRTFYRRKGRTYYSDRPGLLIPFDDSYPGVPRDL